MSNDKLEAYESNGTVAIKAEPGGAFVTPEEARRFAEHLIGVANHVETIENNDED